MEISGIVWLMQIANDIDLLLRLGVLFTFQSILFSIMMRSEDGGGRRRAYCMLSLALSRVPSHTNHYITITLPATVAGLRGWRWRRDGDDGHIHLTLQLRIIFTHTTNIPQCPWGQTWKLNLIFNHNSHTAPNRKFKEVASLSPWADTHKCFVGQPATIGTTFVNTTNV